MRRWRASTVLLATFAVAIGACGPATPPIAPAPATAIAPAYSVNEPALLPDRVTIPLARRGDSLFARAAVAGRDVGEFLIDTGATITVIDEGIADRLGLPNAGEALVVGMHAQETGNVRAIHQLTISDVELAAGVAIALPLDDLRNAWGASIVGIIGYPTLGSVPFTLDFAAPALVLHNPAHFTPPAVESMPLRVHANAPFIEAALEGSDVAPWLLIDTGAGAPIALWRGFVDQHPDVVTVPQKRWATSIGAGGGTQIAETELRALRLFGREIRRSKVYVQAPPPHLLGHPPRVAGLLGAPFLSQWRITIDPATRRIWAEPI